MSNSRDSRPERELPRYLLPLLEHRPSGEAKLLAAWDGLSVENQILLLENLGRNDHLGWTSKIRSKVLASPNAYVRYFGARGFTPHDGNDEETALKKQIEADPEPLVRYAMREDDCPLGRHLKLYSADAASFFALPHEARLATVRSLPNNGERIAGFVHHAVQNELPFGRVTEEELTDLLVEYVTNPHFKSHYYGRWDGSPYDGYGEYQRDKDITALWNLVPNLPKGVSFPLVAYLPEGTSSGTFTRTLIPDEVLNAMPREQLEFLLERRDISLKEFRKKVFLAEIRAEGETSDRTDFVFSYAVSHDFDLTEEEFAEVLAQAEKRKEATLWDLALYASDLRLCVLQATHDVLEERDWGKDAAPYGDRWEAKSKTKDRLAERKAHIQSHAIEWEAHEWRLYQLAKQVVPWKKGKKGNAPSDKLGLLAEHVKEGDTWLTFIAFSQAWKKNQLKVAAIELDKSLQRRFPLTEQERKARGEDDPDDEEDDEKASSNETSADEEDDHSVDRKGGEW